MNSRHRASSDALATVKLFELLLNKDLKKEITKSSIKILEDSKKVLSNKVLKFIDEILHKKQAYFIFMTKMEK